jgi:hypothetical protein
MNVEQAWQEQTTREPSRYFVGRGRGKRRIVLSGHSQWPAATKAAIGASTTSDAWVADTVGGKVHRLPRRLRSLHHAAERLAKVKDGTKLRDTGTEDEKRIGAKVAARAIECLAKGVVEGDGWKLSCPTVVLTLEKVGRDLIVRRAA